MLFGRVMHNKLATLRGRAAVVVQILRAGNQVAVEVFIDGGGNLGSFAVIFLGMHGVHAAGCLTDL